jgi:AraC-like DNA-binding protein
MYSCSEMHPQTYRSLTDARDFMRHAYQRPINLPDISARANLSPYHFLRVFRQTYGETPHEFLTRLRIERAKVLLAKGSHNVTEACFEVGFSSLGSFSTLFARRVGLSPSDYRRYIRSSVAVPAKLRPLFVPTCFFAMLCGPAEEAQLSRSPSRPPVLSSRRSDDNGG